MRITALPIVLFFGFIAQFAQAQVIVVSPNDSAAVSETINDEYTPAEVHIHVINNANFQQAINWKMVNVNLPNQAWEAKLCDNVNCYDLLISAGPYTSAYIPAHDSMDTKFQFTAHCINGTGDCNVVFYIDGDSANTAVVLNYKATIANNCNTAINEVGTTTLKVFPNPVTSSFTVKGFEAAGNVSFEVYDLQGRLAKSEVLSATTSEIEISIATLSPGAYILKAVNDKGKVVATSQLNKID
ncbi:MAG: T9SS type A sorting domain-containing protein [Chitinophagales bacterium]